MQNNEKLQINNIVWWSTGLFGSTPTVFLNTSILWLDYFQHSVEQLKASGLSETELRTKLEEVGNFQDLYKNPLVKFGMTFLEIFPVGFIVSLISAFLLKRKVA